MPASRLTIGVQTASSDGRYHGRYPHGDKPSGGGNWQDDIVSANAFFNPQIVAGTSTLDYFDARNNTPNATIVTDYSLPGDTSAIIKLPYPFVEAGQDLILLGQEIGGRFVASNSLYVRTYDRFEGGWPNNWPNGKKTGRYYTTPDNLGCSNGYAYMSEKMIYPGYDAPPDYPRLQSRCTRGQIAYCNTSELAATYGPTQIFGDGLAGLGEGHFYKCERWQVLNSAVDVADGIIQWWIDNVLVLNLTNVLFRRSTNGGDTPPTLGDQWKSGWIGGNFSASDIGPDGTTLPSTLVHYIARPYMSTSLDR